MITPLVDDRTRVVLAESRIQAEQLGRVGERISVAIREFCDLHCGQMFYADQLRKWVESRCGPTAPGSADRVLRDLRQKGSVSYAVVNRAKSLYRVST